MKPKSSTPDPQDDFFKTRLENLVNLDHKLCRLAHTIDWSLLERKISPNFSDQGAPGLPVRLVAGR